jgi:Cu(I)/Ag(I) efflux system membrane protein CusA/SilA
MNEGIKTKGIIDRFILFFLQNKLITFLWISFIIIAGFYFMPFEYKADLRNPIPVDAIPDIGEKQVIVFADWEGRSPQDVEDQVTYPLSISLQGIPGVKTIRSYSMFGFSTCFVIFNDNVDYYWARSRVMERLNVSQKLLPEGVIPYLGPDATPLGQIFWYTLEGEGFDLQELRSIQDWYVRYALQSVEGVSEVASVGGFVNEYQIDVDPDAMRQYGVGLGEVVNAIKKSNIDVGAKTIEWNGVEYIIRGKGFIKKIEDIENTVIKEYDNVPIFIKNVAKVSTGPAFRRGLLIKNDREVVGGVITCRYGENPLLVINRVKKKIEEISKGLPEKILPDGMVSKVKIIPFYDRTQLIRETLYTLQDTLILEVIITCFVVFLILNHISSSFIISFNLPLAIFLSFILMKVFNVQSNLMSLGGIAIAIGTMVDMGIILCENTLRHFSLRKEGESSIFIVFNAASEVGSAIMTAIATTIFSFLPIFALTGPEGKLFRPLAYTKTFALTSSIIAALTVVPTLSHIFLTPKQYSKKAKIITSIILMLFGVIGWIFINKWFGIPIFIGGIYFLSVHLYLSKKISEKKIDFLTGAFASFYVLLLLTRRWMPVGIEEGFFKNLTIVLLPTIFWSVLALIFIKFYPKILSFLLKIKFIFILLPFSITVFGFMVYFGFQKFSSPLILLLKKIGIEERKIKEVDLYGYLSHKFPGFGREFMPTLDEGSFLFMPVVMPHTSIGEVTDIVKKQNLYILSIPEIENVVAKIGRAETPLDPAPIDMIETIITYKPEYSQPDPKTGKRKRLWRDNIKKPDDIWKEIINKAGIVPGVTSAPKLGPIAARIVMLQTGMRASMGVKVFGTNLKEIEEIGFKIASYLKEVPYVEPSSVIPDRLIAKPYIEIDIDREKISRYGVNIRDVQDVIEVGIGGIPISLTVEGRERYPIRIRYMRELRDNPEELGNILVPSMDGAQIPLSQLAEIRIVSGPTMIKSEGTFLVSYVLFDKKVGYPEVEVVESCKRYIENKIKSGELKLPPGVFYTFSGSYEQQLSFQRRLKVILPFSIFLIFLILYFQFKLPSLTLIVFLQLFCVWGGALFGMFLISREWFLNFNIFGVNLRELFNLKTYNISVPVWVGFLALFGVATDDAVVIGTYLIQQFSQKKAKNVEEVRYLTVEAAKKRARPCFMTTITTVLALYPVLTSIGRGSEVMMPMSIPIVIGMTWELVTLYITPVLFCCIKEKEAKRQQISLF